MNVYFLSDWHLGHKRILNFSGSKRVGSCVEEHDDWIMDNVLSTVKRNDVLICLGDLAFTVEGMYRTCDIRCQKWLLRGNHDEYPDKDYMACGWKLLPGFMAYKGFWLSHCPIHPAEMRNRRANIHGHVHMNDIMDGESLDKRYVNVCVEAVNGIPISLDEIRGRFDGVR